MTWPVEPTVPMTSPAWTVSPDGDEERGLVAVPELGAVLEADDGLVAVGAVVAGGDDHAVGDRVDLVAGVAVEVEAGVVARPEAVLAEAGGEDDRLERVDPQVLGDDLGLHLGLRRPARSGLRRAPSAVGGGGGLEPACAGGLGLGLAVAVAGHRRLARGDRAGAAGAAQGGRGVGAARGGCRSRRPAGASLTVTTPPIETASAAMPMSTGADGKPLKSGPRPPACLTARRLPPVDGGSARSIGSRAVGSCSNDVVWSTGSRELRTRSMVTVSSSRRSHGSTGGPARGPVRALGATSAWFSTSDGGRCGAASRRPLRPDDGRRTAARRLGGHVVDRDIGPATSASPRASRHPGSRSPPHGVEAQLGDQTQVRVPPGRRQEQRARP